VKVQLNRLLAFSPKRLVSEQKAFLHQWQLIDAVGNSVSLEQYKGKLILSISGLVPPCIAEMPSMQKLYNDYQDKIVFFVCHHRFLRKANAFLVKENLNLLIQSETNLPLELSQPPYRQPT
jgi:thiol-disulfide isomerase/thioredoxin